MSDAPSQGRGRSGGGAVSGIKQMMKAAFQRARAIRAKRKALAAKKKPALLPSLDYWSPHPSRGFIHLRRYPMRKGWMKRLDTRKHFRKFRSSVAA